MCHLIDKFTFCHRRVCKNLNKQHVHPGRPGCSSEPVIFNSENMLRREAGRQAEGRMEQRRGLGRRGVSAVGREEMERLRNLAARLGCVGGRGWGLASNLFMAQRLVSVHAL